MPSPDRSIFFPDEPCGYRRARIVFVPVPYDGTSTWGKGADHGPDALFAASEHLEGYDIETGSEVWRRGFFTDAPVSEKDSPEAMVQAVHQRMRSRLSEDKYAVVVGGEHSVSIGAVRAHAEQYPDLTVLQLDAHSDLRQTYQGSPYNHACVMARLRETCDIVQVGVRSMDHSELSLVDPERMFYARDIFGRTHWMDAAVTRLSAHVYITIDLDVFDSAVMPSTGTPEPGGLFWYDVIGLLRYVCQQRHVVGFDVVELCPDTRNKAPDFLAAKLIYQLLSYVFSEKHE